MDLTTQLASSWFSALKLGTRVLVYLQVDPFGLDHSKLDGPSIRSFLYFLSSSVAPRSDGSLSTLPPAPFSSRRRPHPLPTIRNPAACFRRALGWINQGSTHKREEVAYRLHQFCLSGCSLNYEVGAHFIVVGTVQLSRMEKPLGFSERCFGVEGCPKIKFLVVAYFLYSSLDGGFVLKVQISLHWQEDQKFLFSMIQDSAVAVH